MVFVDSYPKTSKLVRSEFLVSFIALGIGALFGVIQALHRTGVFRGFVSSADYYTILTGHGVLLALVFTTFFIAGLFTWAVANSLERELPHRIAWSAFWIMLTGTVLAAVSIIGGIVGSPSILGHDLEADVLFTFYAPMKAHPAFYIGAALIIVGSWVAGLAYFKSLWEWRSENPGERIPLQTFMVLTTMLMWYISTIGVAVEVVAFLIPWSLGLIQNVDPLLTRTLFWYFGHPVVYFWLMPAYLVWYTILPKLAGGRLFSDPLARVVFVAFLLLSTPVGFHHQYTDPGIPSGYKFIAMTNTMFLLLPSLLTAFTVVASVEHGARQRGAKGYLSWLRNLPWGKPAFAGCMLAGLMFAAGGFSGMINAGMNINYLIHNTIWVPGHFHLTVGTAFALTAMAISYWLVPQITGKKLRQRTIATLQPYVWFVGMAVMSNAMHRAGLAGIPRRTAEPTYDEFAFEGVAGTVGEMRIQIAIGGFLLFVGAAMFLIVMADTLLARRGGTLSVNGHIPEPLSGADHSPRILDNYKLWTAIALLLIAIAYGPPLASMVADGLFAPGSPPIPV
ncbi:MULTISPECIES: b(o/a)3-type cytochrome-c oxidase subunit 1 [Haloarcula]|uniref:Cytochrome c oxidase subunit I n=1 Tax=Haloarcula amylolytica JCM 13557 TaxID=1227452 RepID=M0KNA7_9EURY|nr:b(o/a)3-type cytochrome-c oxidase subunit 1 [Haloarcula amylolytica]EMA22651.1 cytochrome c oxidase subunit I [Haloarcula amylolytica JCM 13557]